MTVGRPSLYYTSDAEHREDALLAITKYLSLSLSL